MNKNNEPKIITGLRLSEAIKYLEENEDATIRISTPSDINCFGYLELIHSLSTTARYDIKLPPPKSVSVTRADCEAAYTRARKEYFSTQSELMDAFYKELGL